MSTPQIPSGHVGSASPMHNRACGEPRHILLPRFDTFGDIVLIEGLLEALHERFTRSRITLLVRPGYDQLAPLFPEWLSWEVLNINPYDPADIVEQVARLGAYFRSRRYDLIIETCTSQTWADASIPFVTNPEARRVTLSCSPQPQAPPDYLRTYLQSGVAQSAPPGWNQVVAVNEHAPEHEKYQCLWRALTATDTLLPSPTLRIPPSAASATSAIIDQRGLRPHGYVLCCPAGTQHIALKTWPAESFAEIIAWLEHEHGLRTLLVGHMEELAALQAVGAPAEIRGAHPALWSGQEGDLPTLAALAREARCYFGNDTATMHIAAALARPTIGIFGGGHWPRFVPRVNTFALVAKMPCFGCGWHCLYGEAFCLKRIDVESTKRVIAGVLRDSFQAGQPSRILHAHSDGAAPALEVLLAKAALAYKASEEARGAQWGLIHQLEHRLQAGPRARSVARVRQLLRRLRRVRRSPP